MSIPNMKAIAAMSRNRVIGKEGKIPWRISDEMRWFKEKTTGATVVMGRKTFDSLGRPLPNRRNLVISSKGVNVPGVEVLDHLPSEAEWRALVPPGETLWVIGGEEIYQQLLPLCSELFLTVVKWDVEGDAFFPPFEDDFEFQEVVLAHTEFEVRRYTRKTASSQN